VQSQSTLSRATRAPRRLARDARAHDDGHDLQVQRTLIWPLILPTLALAVLLAVVVLTA